MAPHQLDVLSRTKTNRVLNYVDFAVLFFLVILFIILASTTEILRDVPVMSLVFLCQTFNMYLMFRTKYAIELPFFWCSTCEEHSHLRFIFCNVLFAVFAILCDVFDFFRSVITKKGLL